MRQLLVIFSTAMACTGSPLNDEELPITPESDFQHIQTVEFPVVPTKTILGPVDGEITDAEGRLSCQGQLISSRIVRTAYHCLVSSYRNQTVDVDGSMNFVYRQSGDTYSVPLSSDIAGAWNNYADIGYVGLGEDAEHEIQSTDAIALESLQWAHIDDNVFQADGFVKKRHSEDYTRCDIFLDKDEPIFIYNNCSLVRGDSGTNIRLSPQGQTVAVHAKDIHASFLKGAFEELEPSSRDQLYNRDGTKVYNEDGTLATEGRFGRAAVVTGKYLKAFCEEHPSYCEEEDFTFNSALWTPKDAKGKLCIIVGSGSHLALRKEPGATKLHGDRLTGGTVLLLDDNTKFPSSDRGDFYKIEVLHDKDEREGYLSDQHVDQPVPCVEIFR